MPLNAEHTALDQVLSRLKNVVINASMERTGQLLDDVISFVDEMESKLNVRTANQVKVTFDNGHVMYGKWDEKYYGDIINGQLKLRMLKGDREKLELLFNNRINNGMIASNYKFNVNYEDGYERGELVGCFVPTLSLDDNGISILNYDLRKRGE